MLVCDEMPKKCFLFRVTVFGVGFSKDRSFMPFILISQSVSQCVKELPRVALPFYCFAQFGCRYCWHALSCVAFQSIEILESRRCYAITSCSSIRSVLCTCVWVCEQRKIPTLLYYISLWGFMFITVKREAKIFANIFLSLQKKSTMRFDVNLVRLASSHRIHYTINTLLSSL